MADGLFTELKAMVIDTTGMAFYADKDEELARILHERLAETGVADCAAYLDMLTDGSTGAAEMDALVAELTIGETYFFRHKEQFDALREIVFNDVIERNRGVRRLRIWSAGCATGPEPYSLAIMLTRDFGMRIAGWDISIVGTDINSKFLARAREGRYDDWAFRSVPDDIRRDCFDKNGKHWIIKSEFRRFVTFQHHNLIKNKFPSILDDLTNFDVIICRNVIIYFSKETIQGLIPSFRESLTEGGWLVMGHAEPNAELFRDFRAINTAGAVLYQKSEAREARPTIGAPAPAAQGKAQAAVPPIPFDAPLSFLPKKNGRGREAPPRPAAPVVPANPPAVAGQGGGSGAERVRELADGGSWEEALRACDDLLVGNALDARTHFYRSLILEQIGDAKESEKAVRRAIYLDRRLVLPHYHLGVFLWRRDDAQAAARSFRNALTLLDGVSEDHVVSDGDEITAGQVREAIETYLKLIGAA